MTKTPQTPAPWSPHGRDPRDSLRDRAAKALDETHAKAGGIVASNVPSDDLTFLRARAHLACWLDGAAVETKRIEDFVDHLEQVVRDDLTIADVNFAIGEVLAG